MKNRPPKGAQFFMAGPTGFEPAISSVTGRHVRPLHHEPVRYMHRTILLISKADDSAGAFGALLLFCLRYSFAVSQYSSLLFLGKNNTTASKCMDRTDYGIKEQLEV